MFKLNAIYFKLRLCLFQIGFVVFANLIWDVLTQPMSHFYWSLSTICWIFLANYKKYDDAYVIIDQTLTLLSLDALFWDALITDLFSQGYTIPLDKRLAADGRGLQQVHINENFAKLAEALYIADRKVSNVWNFIKFSPHVYIPVSLLGSLSRGHRPDYGGPWQLNIMRPSPPPEKIVIS